MTSIPIAISGAAGRMGQRLIALARADAAFTVVCAIERPDHPAMGKDAGEVAGMGPIGVPLTAGLAGDPKLLIDFTTPAATRGFIPLCVQYGIAHLIGTTGLSAADHALIDDEAKKIPVLQSPTMALGVAVLYRLAAETAKILGDDYDIEIVEAHHRFKKDAPSGTALGLADAILKATNKTREALAYDRHGDETTRKRGEISMHSLRMGDEVGTHTASFAALGERIELTHRVTSRDTFVHGALRSAKFLALQRPGRYNLSHVLGL